MHQMTGACWLVCYRPLALALLPASLSASYAYQTGYIARLWFQDRPTPATSIAVANTTRLRAVHNRRAYWLSPCCRPRRAVTQAERKTSVRETSMLLTSLLRRHILGMGLTASALSSSAPAAKGAIRYRQLWVSADGVTHIDDAECGKLETKDFTSTGGDAALPESASFRPPRQRRDACLTQAIRARLL